MEMAASGRFVGLSDLHAELSLPKGGVVAKKLTWSVAICLALASISSNASLMTMSPSDSFTSDAPLQSAHPWVGPADVIGPTPAQYFTASKLAITAVRDAVMPPTVPEPSTTVLIGLALAVAVAFRARRRR